MQAAGAKDPFVGRVAELAALAQAFARHRTAPPGSCASKGQAGIGKTALVRAFLVAAAPPVVIFASGDEAETTLPWGVVAQLARDLHGSHCERLQQFAELSAGADPLVSAAPPGGPRRAGGGQPGRGGGRGLPLDRPAVRPGAQVRAARLRQDRVLVVLTTRPEGLAQRDDGWRRLLDDRGQRLRLGALQPAEVTQLAQALGPARYPARRHGGCVRTAGSALYPLADRRTRPGRPARHLRTAARTTVTGDAAGRTAGGLPTGNSGAGIRRGGPGGTLPARPGGRSGGQAVAEALGGALTAGLLIERHEEEGVRQIQFPHPLVRAALYADLSPARRTAFHLSAARLVGGASGLAHRVAAASGPDAELAAELEQTAAAESAAGQHASAARHLITAAGLSADRQRREDQLLAACTVWLRTGAVHEVSARREQLEALPPSPQRDHLRGFLAHLEGRSQRREECPAGRLDQFQASGGPDPRAADAASRLAGLAVFDWDWQAALALVSTAPGDESPLSLLVRCIALVMGGRTGEAWRFSIRSTVAP